MRLRRRKVSPELADEITVQDCLMGARIKAQVTRQQLADAIGKDVAYVLAFERGEFDPRMSELRRYALAAGVHLFFKVEVTPESLDE